MAYTTIDDPTQYFNTVIWTGTSDATTAVTGVGHQPDFVWIKNRAVADDHTLHDSVRGGTKTLFSNDDASEGTNTESIKSFDTDGFTTGNHRGTGGDDGNTMVAWCWKAGTSFSNDASATSIGSIDSSGSVSTDAGFSIVSYTGTTSVGTIKHGLSSVPKIIFFKDRETDVDWGVYAEAIGNTKEMYLSTDDAAGTNANAFNSTTPTSSVFTIGTSSRYNPDSKGVIAYCFADVQGFSKVGGSYTGNGGSQNFIYTGFKPAFVIFKKSSGTNHWNLYDNKRNTSNPESNLHYPSLSDTEASFAGVDFVSNGISIKTDNTNFNDSGGTYVYIAFAEAPFVNSNGVPCNAR
jgi:hypothetical protein